MAVVVGGDHSRPRVVRDVDRARDQGLQVGWRTVELREDDIQACLLEQAVEGRQKQVLDASGRQMADP